MAARRALLAVRAGGALCCCPGPDRGGDLLPRLRVPRLPGAEGPATGLSVLQLVVRGRPSQPARAGADLLCGPVSGLPVPPDRERAAGDDRPRLQQPRGLHRAVPGTVSPGKAACPHASLTRPGSASTLKRPGRCGRPSWLHSGGGMGSREEATEERAPVGAEPSAPYELLRAVEVQLLERREPLRFEQALQLKIG